MADRPIEPGDLPSERQASPMKPRSAGQMAPRASGQMPARSAGQMAPRTQAATPKWQSPLWIVRLCQWLEAPYERQIRSLPESRRREMLGDQPGQQGPASVILHGSAWYGQAGRVSITAMAPGLVQATVAVADGRPLHVTIQWPPLSSDARSGLRRGAGSATALTDVLRQDRMTSAIERFLLGGTDGDVPGRRLHCTCLERTVPFCRHVAAVLRAMMMRFGQEPEAFLLWRGVTGDECSATSDQEFRGSMPAAGFWDGPDWPAETGFGDGRVAAEALPPASLMVGGRDLAEWVRPVCQTLAQEAARQLGLSEPSAAVAKRQLQAKPAGRGEAKPRDPAAWSPLPEASFRSLDWDALSAYCRRHLPESSDEQGRRRFVLAVRNGHAQAAAQRLREALQRWQKVLGLDLTSPVPTVRNTARDKAAAVRSWIRMLDDALASGD